MDGCNSESQAVVHTLFIIVTCFCSIFLRHSDISFTRLCCYAKVIQMCNTGDAKPGTSTSCEHVCISQKLWKSAAG